MNNLPTLFYDKQELLLDIDIYGKIISTPQTSKEDLAKLLFEEFKFTHPSPSMEDERYKLSNLVSTDFKIQYDNSLELQDNESLVDLQQGVEQQSTDIFKIDVPKELQDLFSYGKPVNEDYKLSLMEKFSLIDDEETFTRGIATTEKMYGSVKEDESSVLSDDEIDNIGKEPEQDEEYDIYFDDNEDDISDDEVSDDYLDDDEEYDIRFDDSEDGISDDVIDEVVDSDNSDTDADTYEYDEDEDDEDEYGDYSSEDEDEYDDFSSDDYNEDDSDEDEYEYEDESSDEDEYEYEDDDFSADYPDDEDDEDNDYSYEEEKESNSELEEDESSEEYEYDEDEDDDFSSDYSDDEDDSELEDNDDSEDDDFDDYSSDDEDDDYDDYSSEDEDESSYSEDEESNNDDEFENRESDLSNSEDEIEQSSKEVTNSSNTDTSNTNNKVIEPVSSEKDSFMPDLDDVDVEFTNEPESKPQKIVSETVQVKEQNVSNPSSSEFGDNEPKELRAFLKKHPRCEMSVVLQYFSKKEVETQIRLGKVIKRGNKLRI